MGILPVAQIGAASELHTEPRWEDAVFIGPREVASDRGVVGRGPLECLQREPLTRGVAQRARIALAFKNQDIPEGGSEAADSEDIAFHVTLPRSVVRQIRKLAAETDTSQRAVLLRALRLAGLSVPDGCDIDRPDRDAKRQA